MTNPSPSFILGTGRCGSSLVHELICRHPSTGFMTNLDDRFGNGYRISKWNGPLYQRIPQAWTRKGRIRFAPSEGYRAIEREIGPAISWTTRDMIAEDATPWLSGQLRDFISRRQRRQPDRIFIHKFTGWPRLGFLAAAFPDAKFVQVIRDGRSVANSWLKMDWWRGYEGPSHWQWGELPSRYVDLWNDSNRSYPMLAAIGWMILMDAWEEASAALPPERQLVIRYEDVVSDPEHLLLRVAEFLGLPPNERFRRIIRSYRIDPGRDLAFMRDLHANDVSMMNTAMQDHLRRYGYTTNSDNVVDS